MSTPYSEKDDDYKGPDGGIPHLDANPSQPQYVTDHEQVFGEIEEDIRHEITDHRVNDPNLDPELLEEADRALAKGDEKAELRLEDVIADDSIYPEVRAAVSNVDDPTMRANTFRAWFMGFISTTILTGITMYFSVQWPQVSFPVVGIQLLAYPVGVAMSKIPYPKHWPLADWVNPGPFNIKEHTMISVMATVCVGGGAAYATDIFITQHAYYHEHLAIGYMFLLILSTQLIGFGFAGFCRQALVWPAAMIWPSNLISTAFLHSMHEKHHVGSFRGWSRFKMFMVSGTILFFYEVIPQYLFTGLSVFSWPTWIAPNNKGVNLVFGGSGGIGLNCIALDWQQVTSALGSPMYFPWFAIANTLAGYALIVCIIGPILWSTNVKNTGYLNYGGSTIFDRFGQPYKTGHVVNDQFELDIEKYNSYSKQYLGAQFMLSYALGFGAITSTLVHTALFYGKDIVRQYKRSLSEEPDIHARLMSRYPEVPHWWYGSCFLISLVFGLVAIEKYHTDLPVWMFFIAILLSAVYMIPLGVITAVTGFTPGLNVISEMIAGYAMPGKPVAMMIFKTYGYMTSYMCISFVSDFKLGHYMKVPPRTMFMCQLVATIWSCIIQVGITCYLFSPATSNLCAVQKGVPVRPAHFTCAYQKVFYSASIIWGLIGPARSFAVGENYAILNILFIIGAVVPIPTWYLAKRYPKSWVRLINWPLFFGATGMMPPGTGINFTSWFLVGWFFQYFIRRNHFEFWSDYNYILSAGMSAGAALMSFLVAVCLEVPTAPDLINNVFTGDNPWWGNAIETNTLQGRGSLVYKQPPANGFAPAPDGIWHSNPFAASAST